MSLCFCDQDGILADFVTGCCQVHNRPNPYEDPANRGIFDLEKIWGISVAEFYKPTNSFDFWANLTPMPEAESIVKYLTGEFGIENICVLTSPSLDPGCVPGKRAWVQKHFPQLGKQIIYTSAKRFLAGPNRFLIDDRDKNINEFSAAGGTGIMVPRLWNRLYNYSDRVMWQIKTQVELSRLGNALEYIKTNG